MASIEKGNFICCKFLGVPDVIKNSIRDLPPILTADVDLNRKSWRRSMYDLGYNFTRNPLAIEKAYRRAWEVQNSSELSRRGKNESGGGLTIGLLAHSYNIYDTYANMGIVSKLEALGATVITPDMLPTEAIRNEGRSFSRELYWTYGKEIVGAACSLAKGKANGIILLTSFGCGPDSLMSELIIRKLRDRIPMMSLVFDEETGEAGLSTRLESFVDMIKRRI
jgi:predicted nucleotide-binding protein (sugar kinase/HSP70/actin superfamily)